MEPSSTNRITFALQPRDIDILRSLFESRVMTSEHIAALHFNGRPEAAKKRLQKLKSAGLLSERSRKPFEPAVLSLTRRGILFLHDEGILAEYPPFALPTLERRARVSDQTVRHELQVMDVKVSFHSQISESAELSLEEFSTWPLLYEFETDRPSFAGSDILVKPDGFVRILAKNEGKFLEHRFFLEVDRSTETQDTLVTRAGAYLEYFKSGGFAVRNGSTRTSFKDYPFRVLFVFKSAEHRNNFAERLIEHSPPILSQAWLTTLDEVRVNPLGKIWMRPIDYRDGLKGSSFLGGSPRNHLPYRRQTARDLLVESNVSKRPLI